MLELIAKLQNELSKASFTKKLWLYLAIAGVAIASAIAFLVKDYFNKKAKLTAAQTKDDVADAKYKAKVEALAVEKTKLEKVVKDRDAALATASKAIDATAKAAKNDKEVIDGIASWEDVDAKIRR